MKSGFARAKVPCLKNLDVLLPRIDAKKITDATLQDTKKNVEAYRSIWSPDLIELNFKSL